MATTTSVQIANMALAYCGESKAIATIDADAAKTDRLCNRFYTPALDELMELFPFQHAIEHSPLILAAYTYEYQQDYNYDPVAISAISKADPCVVTAETHGLSTGHYAYIYDVGGMAEINQELPFKATATDVNTLTLDLINSTNWTAYTSGGYVRRLTPKAKYHDGYIYELPSDYGIAIQLENPTTEYEIVGAELYTIEEDAVLIYVKSGIATVTLFKALFVNCLALRIACKICVPLVGATAPGLALKEKLQKDYGRALQEAILAAAKEGFQPADTTDPWITARG